MSLHYGCSRGLCAHCGPVPERVYKNATIRTCGRCGYQSNVIGDLERHRREAHPKKRSSVPLILDLDKNQRSRHNLNES